MPSEEGKQKIYLLFFFAAFAFFFAKVFTSLVSVSKIFPENKPDLINIFFLFINVSIFSGIFLSKAAL